MKAVRKVKDVTNILTVLLCLKKYQTRQQERNLVIPNERQTTQSGTFFRCTLKKPSTHLSSLSVVVAHSYGTNHTPLAPPSWMKMNASRAAKMIVNIP